MKIRRPLLENNGLVTLLELLRFYADHFAKLRRDLTWMTMTLCRYEGSWISRLLLKREKKQWGEFRDCLENLELFLDEAGMNRCVSHIEDLANKLKLNGFLESSDVAGLEDDIERELEQRVFLSISHERQKYFSAPLAQWEVVIDKFPDAQEDVEEMNKCYALSRYTASVFHSLLVVEHGLIALGNRIGVSDPKLGWDATYRKLDVLLRNRASVPAELDFGFLEQTKARLDSMKLAWRNKVNHAAGRLMIEKTGFTDVSAEEVIIACRSFMRHLAEGFPQ
jgi:hypothetical protein